jgi:hypothetical protein
VVFNPFGLLPLKRLCSDHLPLPNSFYETSITFIPKKDRDTSKKKEL